MPPKSIKKCLEYDRSESNVATAILNFFAGILAIVALSSEQWIVVQNPEHDYNANVTWPPTIQKHFQNCTSIGIKHFWLPATFKGFTDNNGITHILYHYDGTVLADCISPMVANFFYVLIALCFVVVIMTLVAAIFSILTPPFGFLTWLRRNSILEICNVLMASLACLSAIVAQFYVEKLRPLAEITIGTGMIIILLSSVVSFAAIMCSWRMKEKLKIARRLDNRRLMCHRTLRSWRDFNTRPEDMRPIIDFERLLLEPTARAMHNTSANNNTTTTSVIADPAQLVANET